MSQHSGGDSTRPDPLPLDGRYRILSKLGSGGMADVYLAEDQTLGRRVAIKVLKEQFAADDEFVERFRIEAQAAASLNHPAIVAVYDRGKAGPSPYIAMEYVEGESLRQRLRRDGPMSAVEASTVTLAVLAALRAAHARHIVHRDITASNVLLDEAGRVKVTDFGIARMGDSALTRTGAMLGTSTYLSPEQAQGRPADERSDLYSLGVVLFEMLTGRLPFRGESDVAVAMQHVSAAPPNPRSLVPDVPEAYAVVVMKALSKRPEDRYQSAEEFEAAVRWARGGGEGAIPGPAAVPRPHAAASAAAYTAVATRVAGPAAGPAGAQAAEAPRPARDSVSEQPRRPAGDATAPATIVASDALTRRAPVSPAEREPRPVPAPRPRRRRWLVLVLVLLFAAAGGWALYAFVLTAGAKVPGVIGKQSGQAVVALRKQGLKPDLHQVWADRYEAGVVARQRPKAGTKVDDGVQVDLWVSKGPLHIPAPDLSGMSAGGARSALEQQVLVGSKRKAASLTAPKGQVFRQQPVANATVTRGDTVTFWVSSGPPMVSVPNVVGMSEGDAKAALQAEGFTASVDLVAGWGTFPGDVVDQDPAAGSRLRKGDEVVIKVAVF